MALNLLLLADMAIAAVAQRLPMLSAMAKKVGPEDGRSYYGLGDAVKVPVYGAITASDYHATTNNYETATDDNQTLVSVTLNKHALGNAKISKYDIRSVDVSQVVKEATKGVAKKISDDIGALILSSVFTNTAYNVADVTAFDFDDIIALGKKASDLGWSDPICMLNSTLYSNLKTDSRFIPGNSGSNMMFNGVIPSLDEFRSIMKWTGLPDNSQDLAGFITDGNGLLFTSQLMFNEEVEGAKRIDASQAVDPETGIAIQISLHQSDATRDYFVNCECLYGIDEGPVTRLTRITDAVV
jgi:hypothetical protein